MTENFGVENFPWTIKKCFVENFLSKIVMFAPQEVSKINSTSTWEEKAPYLVTTNWESTLHKYAIVRIAIFN